MWPRDSRTPRVNWQPPTIELGISKIEEKNLQKIAKNVISRKLRRIEQSFLEARLASS